MGRIGAGRDRQGLCNSKKNLRKCADSQGPIFTILGKMTDVNNGMNHILEVVQQTSGFELIRKTRFQTKPRSILVEVRHLSAGLRSLRTVYDILKTNEPTLIGASAT